MGVEKPLLRVRVPQTALANMTVYQRKTHFSVSSVSDSFQQIKNAADIEERRFHQYCYIFPAFTVAKKKRRKPPDLHIL